MDPALLTAEQLLALYATSQLSPLEALRAVLDRIARHNPDINAFVLFDPRAEEAAIASTARWQAGRPIGPLDGVPPARSRTSSTSPATRRGAAAT